jgi:hypothetical protein
MLKQCLAALMAATLCCYACKDEQAQTLTYSGQIIGPDLTLCACCGGYMLQTADSTYRFDNLPTGSDIDLQNATFPLSVRFEFEQDLTRCIGWKPWIVLTDIEIE